MSQFKVISNDEANSLCDMTDAYEELSPLNEDWQLSLKSDGTFHLYWHFPLSQRDLAIKQWKRCQPRINEFIGKRPITTVSWADEPLHPINDCSRFYNADAEMSPLHQPLAPNEGMMSNKFLYRFLLPHASKLSHIFDGNSFTFSKNEYAILDQLHGLRDGIPKEVAYAADIIIATLQADNERFVVVVE